MSGEIRKLSEATRLVDNEGVGLVMVGSFAPVHEGHLDAMQSAEEALLLSGENVLASTFTPNSDSYVSIKLNDLNGTWNFDRRVEEFSRLKPTTQRSAYIDDITGRTPPERSISEHAIENISNRLGIEACRLVLVVGADQIGSMRPHLESNRAICVLRPGWEPVVNRHSSESWFLDAVESGRYIFTDRKNNTTDIQSTLIRMELEGLESA